MRLGCALLAATACAPDWQLPEPAATAVQVTLEPEAASHAAPAVLRMRVRRAHGSSALDSFRLFSGTLSGYHLGRLEAGELPATLVEREIPVVRWAEPPDVVVAPARVLSDGPYTLASPEWGAVLELAVAAAGASYLRRVWPPAEDHASPPLILYCGDGEVEGNAAPEPVALAPAFVPALVARGLDERGAFATQCARVEPVGEWPVGSLLLPPIVSGAGVFEPRPVRVERLEPPPVICGAQEVALGPACATVEDDRVVLRAPDAASYWAILEPAPRLAVVTPGVNLVVRGFTPGARSRLVATTFDRAGTRVFVEHEFVAKEPLPHLVINEVLANPNGPEPASEWIELFNDGTAAVELSELELADGGGTVALPAYRVEPQQFVVLVGEAYAPSSAVDVAPSPAANLVRVLALGTAGLANGGEPLQLLDGAGVVWSRFPSRAASKAGVSLARRSPDAPDDVAESFGFHAPPGASPGAPNELADTE